MLIVDQPDGTITADDRALWLTRPFNAAFARPKGPLIRMKDAIKEMLASSSVFMGDLELDYEDADDRATAKASYMSGRRLFFEFGEFPGEVRAAICVLDATYEKTAEAYGVPSLHFSRGEAAVRIIRPAVEVVEGEKTDSQIEEEIEDDFDTFFGSLAEDLALLPGHTRHNYPFTGVRVDGARGMTPIKHRQRGDEQVNEYFYCWGFLMIEADHNY